MGFNEFLKDEMSYQGLTTKELAEKSGVNKRTIDHYLRSDPQEPSVMNAYKIAKALNVSIEYLLTGKEYSGFVPFTGQLQNLVDDFQSLADEQQKIVCKLVQMLSSKNIN